MKMNCESFYYSIDNVPEIIYSKNHLFAQYQLFNDLIVIPNEKEFHDPAVFWSTVYHELTHRQFFRYQSSTQTEIDDDDSQPFAECVAEAGAALLCKQSGVFELTKENHISYIKGWKMAFHYVSSLNKVIVVVLEMMAELLNKKIYRVDLPIEIRGLFLGNL